MTLQVIQCDICRKEIKQRCDYVQCLVPRSDTVDICMDCWERIMHPERKAPEDD